MYFKKICQGAANAQPTLYTRQGSCALAKVIKVLLDDKTQVDSKPDGQPEHASLNQCQLIASNRPKLVLWAPPAGGGDKVSL